MDDDAKVICVLIVSVLLATTVMVSVAINSYNKRIIASFEKGYQEETLPGYSGLAWRKVKE